MRQIVLDKSFLQATPKVWELCEQAIVIITDSLFYELITSDKDSLQNCFGHLPNRHNPVMIVSLETLLYLEKEKGFPYGDLTEHAFKEHYIFNKKLREGTFVFKGDVKKARKQWQDKVKVRTQKFIEICKRIHNFFPELNGITWTDFPKAIDKARCKVAEDHDFISDISPRVGEISHGKLQARLNSSWAWFRLIQCQMLCALRLFGKWQGQYPQDGGAKFYKKMEHSMLDADYVVMGTLAGGLATNDNEIREDFIMVCPQGELIPK